MTNPLQKQLPPWSALEPRLRPLLPANVYAEAWVNPTPRVLTKVFDHLRALNRNLYDYIPRQVSEDIPNPGESRYAWDKGTLMFTDLSGFTKLMEANAPRGRAGAEELLYRLNDYFKQMIEIINQFGGSLLEFTGDAMLAQFQPDQRHSDTAQAVRAGLKMQREMERSFSAIETAQGVFALKMRVGVHYGRFFTADIGTPRRMEHVLLGNTVQRTKLAEGAGIVGRVNLTDSAYEQVKDEFRFEPGQKEHHMLVIDDLQADALDDFVIAPTSQRTGGNVLLDRSIPAIVGQITDLTNRVEPLSCYLPAPVLNLLVENALTYRPLPPDFPEATIMFINLIGLPESVDVARPEEESPLVEAFSYTFAQINAAVEAQGGMLKKVTYHVGGSDIVVYFGVPTAHTDDSIRAANAAWAIRRLVIEMNSKPPTVDGKPVNMTCQIGLSRGRVFAAEIGDTRGRREFNVQGDTVNTAARLMDRAINNQIYMTEPVYLDIKERAVELETLEPISLKGKAKPTPVYALREWQIPKRG
jgi:class 3 adenylate cyclase